MRASAPLLAVLLFGCKEQPPAASPASAPLAVDARALERDNPKCARKIAESPYAYFRYTNRPFVDLVCDRYASSLSSMPYVHAHGDAHVEQYAVAAEGRGLADFDASAVGPHVVDLARFATSLVLATSDDAAARAAISAFLDGYDRGIDDPLATIAEPAVAARLRAQFAPTTVAWLDRVEKLIIPMEKTEMAPYESSWVEFSAKMRQRDPSIAPDFFVIKVGGRTELGIGSANSEKFLVRIEGPTKAPDDDLVMEAKALAPGSLGSCMRGADLDAARVILGQELLSGSPQRFLAAVSIKGRPFYSHTWLVHYRELAITDVGSGAELAELATDVGLQLGRGHARVADPAQIAAHRAALRASSRRLRPNLANEAFALAREVRRAWETYVAHYAGTKAAG